MRPIWSGGISFGLIYIPVKLYSAAESVYLDLDLLSKKGMEPVGYEKIIKSTGERIENEDIVRGFEYEKGKYVILDQDELEGANPAKTKSIAVVSFIDIDEVDLKLVEKPYILEPEDNAEKTFALFFEALKNTKKAALGKFVLRNKEHLVIILPEGNHLSMIQLRYSSELKDFSKLKNVKNVKLEDEELEMAESLIRKLTKRFDPDRFKDLYKEEVMEMIEEKAKKNKITKRSDSPKVTNVSDLMKQLKESLKEA